MLYRKAKEVEAVGITFQPPVDGATVQNQIEEISTHAHLHTSQITGSLPINAEHWATI